MKRYTLCTILFVCVACCAQGCGKTEYNDAFKQFADFEPKCEASGGKFIAEDGKAICECKSNTLEAYRCYNQICNTERGESKCGECEDNKTRCEAVNGELLYQICEGSIWKNTGKICDIGSLDVQKTCNKDGGYSCDGNDLYTCIDGKNYIVKCPDGCDKQKWKCIDKCTEKFNRCSKDGKYIEICYDEKYETIYCPFGCVTENNEVKCAASTTTTCNEGDEKCEVSSFGKPVHYKCVKHEKTETGERLDNTWEVLELCESGSCDSQMKSCGCVDGVSYRCDDDNKNQIVTRCESIGENYTRTVDGETKYCQYGCQNGVCKCQEGAVQCADDFIETCIGGKWSRNEDKCEYGCSGGVCNACSVGKKKCVGNDVVLCGSDGKWSEDVYEYCDYQCADGECICESGSVVCEGNMAKECINGKWQTKICASDKLCFEGDCVDCYPGSKVCDSNFKRECDGSGKWGESVECPKGCNGNECKECDYGIDTKSCRDNSLYSCNVNNQWELDDSCEKYGCGYIESGEARCIECQNNECGDDERILKICKNGFWEEPNKCPIRTKCRKVNGSDVCACIDGISIENNQFNVCQDGNAGVANNVEVKCENDVCHLFIEGKELVFENIKNDENFDYFDGNIDVSMITLNELGGKDVSICIDKVYNGNNGVTGAYSFSFRKDGEKYNVKMNYCGVCGETHTGCIVCKTNMNDSSVNAKWNKQYMYDGIPAYCNNGTWKHDSKIRLHDCGNTSDNHYLYGPMGKKLIEDSNVDFCNNANGLDTDDDDDILNGFNDEVVGCYDSINTMQSSMYVFRDESGLRYRSCGKKSVLSQKEDKTKQKYIKCNEGYSTCEGDCVAGVYIMSASLSKQSSVCYDGKEGTVACVRNEKGIINCAFENNGIINTEFLCIDVYDSSGERQAYLLKKHGSEFIESKMCDNGCNDKYNKCKE